MSRPAAVTALIVFAAISLTTPSLMASPQSRSAGTQELSLDPTPLEAFAARPGVRLTWTRTVGTLESEDSTATFVAIALEDWSVSPRTEMRGLRIDLKHKTHDRSCRLKHVSWAVLCARPGAALYYTEDALDATRDLVLLGRAGGDDSRGVIRMSSGIWGPGLLIGGYSFYGATPAAAAALFADGVEALRMRRSR